MDDDTFELPWGEGDLWEEPLETLLLLLLCSTGVVGLLVGLQTTDSSFLADIHRTVRGMSIFCRPVDSVFVTLVTLYLS